MIAKFEAHLILSCMGSKNKDLTSTSQTNAQPPVSTKAEVNAFLDRLKSAPSPQSGARGRLIFALDATMSRQPTWDMACQLQGEMFKAADEVSGLLIQLVYFRGFGECRAGKWVADGQALARVMTGITCQGGQTQIRKVLTHALKESRREKVNALVYVGDAMEENVDELCARAGELGLLGTPVFLFQEGQDPRASEAFAEIARLTKGAHLRLNPGAADELRRLLNAVATYAAGGRKALLARAERDEGARRLISHMW